MAENRQTCSLTQKEAIARATSIKKGSIDYKIFLNLNKGDSYKGLVFIAFEINDEENVFLDFCGDKVDKIFINGDLQDTTSSPEAYSNIHKDGHIYIPKGILRTDNQNIIEVHFSNRYFKDGNGLHTYTDVDGKQYLYIQSEPFWNNRVIPFFDQPNLKGKFTFHALIPEDWIIVTSVNPENVTNWKECHMPTNGLFGNSIFRDFKEAELPGEYNYWRFPQSAILPTYLFSFVCGPYYKIDSKEENRLNGLPAAIYCRESMAQFVEPQAHNIFEYNKRGIEYYEEAFGMDYMFTKIDTIICPEYTIGAMEYPGAVTYSERLCPRGPNSIEDISLRGKVIMHELAHMWFGDAVSIQWWNDTWLKESFADFACYICAHDQADKMGFETAPAMNSFLLRKCWGYQEDFQCTSHPIAAEVESTKAADGVFDGISYSKGAATLKQLVFLIGFDNFKKAMKVYFERFAWGNTELKDLLEVYKETLGELAKEHPALDVVQWGEDWLGTPGTNVIELQWTKDSSNGVIVQTAAREMFPKLRYHKIRIAFFNQEGQVIRTMDSYINNVAETEIDLGDLSEVAAILPNYEDHDFVIVKLDEVSRNYFKENLSKIEGELTRTIIIKSFYDMVRNHTIKASDLCDLCVGALVPSITNYSMNSIFFLIGTIMADYLKQEQRDHYNHIFFQKLMEINKTITDRKSDKASVVFEKLVSHAHSDEDIQQIYHIYQAYRLGFGNITPGVNDQWRMVRCIMNSTSIPLEERKRIFDELYEEDKTDTKIQWKLIIDSMLSRGEERMKILEECLEENLKFSYHHLQYRLMGLNCTSVPEEERAAVFKVYGGKIKELINNRSRSIGKSFLAYFFPRVDDLSGVLEQVRGVVQEGDVDEFTLKKLKQMVDDMEMIHASRNVE